MNNYSPNEKGKAGEKYTEKYLKKNGFRILENNMRNNFGEIDIIAMNKEYIIFVEVKSRSSEDFSPPSKAVDLKKQKRILSAAHDYLRNNPIKRQPRFDVSEVFLDKETFKPYKINYIVNAYIQGGNYAIF